MIKNTCVQCGATWEVDADFAYLDNIDRTNLLNHGKLFSVCEDCDPDGECVAVLMPLERR